MYVLRQIDIEPQLVRRHIWCLIAGTRGVRCQANRKCWPVIKKERIEVIVLDHHQNIRLHSSEMISDPSKELDSSGGRRMPVLLRNKTGSMRYCVSGNDFCQVLISSLVSRA